MSVIAEPIDQRSVKDIVRHAANQLRASFDEDLAMEPVLRFGTLMDAIERIPDEGANVSDGLPNSGEASATVPDASSKGDGPDPVTVPLHWPVQVETGRVDRLTLLPPRFADVEAVEKGEISEIDMHARMADVPAATLRELRWSDFEVVTVMARHLAPQMRRR